MKSLLVFLALYSCDSQEIRYPWQSPCPLWENSIHNPENAEFVVEVAFNEDVTFEEVTQEMFDKRYGSTY